MKGKYQIYDLPPWPSSGGEVIDLRHIDLDKLDDDHLANQPQPNTEKRRDDSKKAPE